MRKTLGVWKTTILGGVFFLLPFALVVFLVGQLAEIIWSIAQPLAQYLPQLNLSLGFISTATIAATLLLVLLCYLAGLAARRSIATHFAGTIEKNLLLLFPRYAVLKDQFASNLGGKVAAPHMKPVLVQLEGAARLGFEADRGADLVSVYLPGSPDPWQGVVVYVPPERVQALAADFGAAVALCESMGRTSAAIVGRAEPPVVTGGSKGAACH